MSVQTTPIPPSDPRLGWVSQHDSRSLRFASAERIAPAPETPRTWTPGAVLDQGQEGSCVGHGWTGELLASPRPHVATPDAGHRYAVSIYRDAQQIDEWVGEDYEGTSVLAGAKVVTGRGFLGEYRWALSIEDVRNAVISEGPVVIGIPWYSQMYSTRASGLVEVGGDLVGGHCLLLHRYHPSMRIPGEDWHARFRVFGWVNSWGPGYGVKGKGLIRYEDLRDLLTGIGEACVPMDRKLVRLPAVL